MMPLTLTVLLLAADAPAPEQRALDFLARETPRWSAQNKCYSCHNNGDGARALYVAVRLGRKIPQAALEDSTAWLSRPDKWKANGGAGAFNDQNLAGLQFAAALVEAVDAGLIEDAAALGKAAELVAGRQDKDGGWTTDADGVIGSPVTHGRALATYLARKTLTRVDAKKYARAIARADDWARRATLQTVPDAAGVLLTLDRADDEAAHQQRRAALTLLIEAEAKAGGWGPNRRSANEVFDTAVALLALAGQPQDDKIQAMRRRGRAYLLSTQQEDGGWPETTRPTGGESYAQRVATSAWATLALLASAEE